MLKLIESPDECAHRSLNVFSYNCEHHRGYCVRCNDPNVFPIECPLQTGMSAITVSLIADNFIQPDEQTVGNYFNYTENLPKRTTDRRDRCTHHTWFKDVVSDSSSHKCLCRKRSESECIGVDCGYYTTESEQQSY